MRPRLPHYRASAQAGGVLAATLGILALLLVLIGVSIAAAWAPDRPVSALSARWAPPPSQFVTIDGLQVHLRDEGPRDDPQPIVLLHGTSASLHTWEGWAADLSKHRRVIRFDLPGFGLTGPARDNDYTLARYVRFVSAVYDHLGLQRSVLAGNSLGGGIAWQAALAMPERVQALILVDAGGYPMAATSVPIGFRLANVPALAPLMANILPRRMIADSLRDVYGDPDKVTPELIERYYELTLRAGNRQALVERFRQTTWGEAETLARRITQPTLILWGGQDRLIPPEHGERFARDIAGSRLVVFPSLGHVPQEEDPATTVAAVRDFLARLPRA